MSARKAKAEATYETRKQAFNDQARGPTDDPTRSMPPNGGNGGQNKVADKPRRSPSRPRILGLDNETNYVGENQQKSHGVTGEKYGFYTVVNDAFFDRGPTVSEVRCLQLKKLRPKTILSYQLYRVLLV